MKRTYIIYILFLCYILTNLCACTNNGENIHLSDLGGVFSASMKDLDFSIEISGLLSEGGQFNNTKSNGKINASLDEINTSVNNISQGQNFSKILRWGISRKPNGQTPAADPGAPELLSKYGGVYIGDTTQKKIYLTFDEGYENGYTAKILDVLKNNGVKAVFFITGPYLKDHMDLVERMVAEGHSVGNHTIHHYSLPELDPARVEEEVLGLDRAFYEKFNKHMKFLRPPKGEYSEMTLAVTQKLGYCNMFWSFAYDDWYRDKVRGPEYALDIVTRNLHNGAILLLHAVSKDNADALDSIIKTAIQMGYTFGDPETLIPAKKENSNG